MTTNFDDLDAVLSGAMESAFCEVAVLTPRSSTQYSERSADPAHAPAQVTGIFSAGPSSEQIGGQQRGKQFTGTSRFAAQHASFWISRAQAAALSRRPGVGDKLTLASRAGTPSYAISRVEPTDMGDLTLVLVIEDATP